jgi:hypothetical protein
MTGKEIVDLVFALSIPTTMIVFLVSEKLSYRKEIREWEGLMKDLAAQREEESK